MYSAILDDLMVDAAIESMKWAWNHGQWLGRMFCKYFF